MTHKQDKTRGNKWNETLERDDESLRSVVREVVQQALV